MDVPLPLHRTMVYKHGLSIMLTGHGPIKAHPTNCDGNNNRTFETQWEYKYMIEGMVEQLRLAFINGKAIAVSDGSFQWGNGAAAWIIEGSTARNQIIGTGRTPGQATDQSTYQSELFGLWGILFALTRFITTAMPQLVSTLCYPLAYPQL